jgi:hypothetical protein
LLAIQKTQLKRKVFSLFEVVEDGFEELVDIFFELLTEADNQFVGVFGVGLEDGFAQIVGEHAGGAGIDVAKSDHIATDGEQTRSAHSVSAQIDCELRFPPS